MTPSGIEPATISHIHTILLQTVPASCFGTESPSSGEVKYKAVQAPIFHSINTA